MGNSTSRVVGCFAPNGKENVSLDFLEPLDEGLGHSFCYVRPVIVDSPAITPSNSERYTLDSSTFDSETHSGSFRQEIVEGPSKNFAETTFKTISGASVSANASTARTPTVLLSGDTQEPAASFESTASFAAIPLQPVPRGSGPLNGFMSGPLERGFMSGPLDKGTFMSGPLDSTDRSNFSAPLGYGRKRGFGKLMRSALSRTFSKRSHGPGWIKWFFLHRKEEKSQTDTQRNWDDVGPSEPEYSNSRNLQWAHGKAGEDRVHVVLSEEQGWLFVGIYDGFSGPDAPDFLMSNLYKAIDKELEGLLWDYDDKPQKSSLTSDHLETDIIEASSATVTELCDEGVTSVQINDAEECDEGVTSIQINEDENGRKLTTAAALSDELEGADEITEEKTSTIDIVQVDMASGTNQGHGANSSEDITGQVDAPNLAATNSAKNSRKSKRLCELLQMELLDEKQARLPHLVNMKEELCSRDAQLVSCARENSGRIEGADALRESEGVSVEDSNVSENKYTVSFTSVGHKQMAKSLIGSKLRKMYKKQKALQKRFFPWSYDWHREQHQVDESTVNTPAVIRRCKSGPVDHDAVLRAMMHALATTEEAYMDMVESSLDRNPELALMGSCVLVMLMKDQDVYVMNLGDSRVILAQDRLIDAKDDARSRNRSRESIVRVELDRISEESPMHNPNSRVCSINKNREISLCRLKMRALQLSTDHSTSIEEEVSRIKAEHVEDIQAVLNDRVKGQLKVTRAFGAGFLKKPNFNDALLEMFQIDYIGSSPYLSCIPSVHHQRLCSSDRFLVLSSDGLYQYFSNEEVVSHVAWFIENVPEGDPAQYLISELLFRAATKNGMDFHELLDIPHGDRRKYHDDVSVMVISLEGRIWRSSG